jgi:Fanconi anemia group M protein
MNKKKQIKLISKFKPRLYQENIFVNCLNKNSFVVLPTGLGKTIIALMLFVFYYNQTNKKILFLAPTKPLVIQQKKSFEKFVENKNDFKFCELLGSISPKKREILYEENDFFFGTPQLIENDIISNRINLEEFCFVVFDEAHRASKNYAYCFLAETFKNYKIKTLSLSASPGSNYENINQVMENLFVEHLEIKKNEDLDVKPYVYKTQIEKVIVELSPIYKKIYNLLLECYKDIILKLNNIGFLEEKKYNKFDTISKTEILKLQTSLRIKISAGETDSFVWEAISLTSALIKLDFGIELLMGQEIKSCYNYLNGFYNKDNSKAVDLIKININFRQAYQEIENLKDKDIKHPKITELEKILKNEIEKNKNFKAIIFNSYRDTASKLNEEISKIKNINSSIFVGQSKKGEVNFTQKKQKEIIEKFRNNVINILVSTSVGEEGLDIPQVDLVIFYEPIPSAIRTIQRVGRTGRGEKGRAIILMTKDTKEITMNYVSNAKQKSMNKALEKIKNELKNKKVNTNKNLLDFEKKEITNKKKEDENEEKKIIEVEDFEFEKIKKNLT